MCPRNRGSWKLSWLMVLQPCTSKRSRLHNTCISPNHILSNSPSADNVLGFVERSRVERGQLVGPRIFQTGTVIYGASEAQFHQDVVNMDDAHQVLTRIRAEGGSFTTSYKNYNIPSRCVSPLSMNVPLSLN